MNKIKTLLLFITTLTTLPATSYTLALDRTYIENFVKSYVEKNTAVPTNGKVDIKVSKIDPRVAIKPCLSSLSANIPEKHSSRNVNVKIICKDSTPWQMFIPVKISTMVPVLVATTGISKGSILNESNISIEYRDQSKLRGEIINNTNKVTGAKSKRTISKGSAITRRNICLVCKGESVIISAISNDFSIKTTGIALKDGSIGDQISVKNRRSGKTIMARVSAINHVVVDL
ncbi:MAG: flagellar basal body P-ring formation protein FlgA [Alteromonadaceae bacterium]|nr:flagellar basal body P-ring formation protein FlgA [Alteromonadaceae bacterium]